MPRGGLRAVGMGHELPGDRHELPAGGSESQSPARSVEEPDAEVAFELEQLTAERRLRDPDLPRGGGHRAGIDDGEEVLDTAKVHAPSLCRDGMATTLKRHWTV